MNIQEIRLRFASKVIAHLCKHKYKDTLEEVANELGEFKVIQALKYNMNTYSLLAETNKEKIVIKIVDNVLKSRKLLRNNVEALRIISKEPRIPAPKILIYREGLLVTTFIEGIPYSECKDNNIKAKAREELREVIIAMRNIRSSHGKYLDITRCEDENITIDDAIKLYPWVERCKDEGFVMSHNDLHTSNVIVNDTGLAGVIDWELAGFYPSSYEKLKYESIRDNYSEFIQDF